MKKRHIPAPGKSTGLQGQALCGRQAEYGTGDHEQIRRLARAARTEGDTGHYCRACMARLD